MEKKETISKTIALAPAQDFDFLRKEGLTHIEGLSHALWTDYNTHDPGITILEAICFAITELGYRNDFCMKDLVVTDGSGITDNDRVLYTAKEILTTNPLTINDYRKLLVDIDGIHNAWLFAADSKPGAFPVNEIPIYADFTADQLTYDVKPTLLFPSGLYEVLLDMENDDRFGDLNTGDIVLPNPSLPGVFLAGEFFLRFEFPVWSKETIRFAERAADTALNHLDSISIVQDGQQWKCTVLLDDGTSLTFPISLAQKPNGKIVTVADIVAMVQGDFAHFLFHEYFLKLSKTRSIIQSATKRLHEHRNLCEDFISIKAVRTEEVAFCFDIDVQPAADIEKVQAAAFFAIEEYLNPSINFYALRELLDRKIRVDDIFNGPILSHGFIDTEQLETTQLRSVIHTSDIINLVMDIEGVLAVRNFVMTKYDEDGKAVPGQIGLTWCMHIEPLHKPILSKERSKILLFKNQFPFLARYDEVRDSIFLLHAQSSRDKLNGLQQDLPVPVGRKRDTESHWPVQYDFPQTYGIGEFGLPANVSPERVAKQRQLKAYLLFYEQVLADFFSQLTHAPHLLSIADIKQTYFAQFLGEIKDTEAIYKTDAGTVLLEEAILQADSSTAADNSWKQLYENRQTFHDRRGRFLDHLLARFSESFNDYAMLMFRINYEDQTEEKIDFSEIQNAKRALLRNYPSISAARGKAFNYYPQRDDFSIDTEALWNTLNVSGLEKRISALTGIADPSRRFLYCMKNIEIVCTEKLVNENGNELPRCFHEFAITTKTGVVLRNSQVYETKATAEEAVVKIIELGKSTGNYSFNVTDHNLQLTSDGQVLMQSDANTFSNNDDALKAVEALVTEFNDECGDPVGLHLLEHILLRPRVGDYKLMEVCLHKGECFCDIDPYSFRASVVLPYWPGHFDNIAFREYFESKIREEAPAHVQLKICWLSNDLMREFEVRYKEWIEQLAAFSADAEVNGDSIRNANDKMIEVLSMLHSEYPLATLHNCEESKEGSNTVILGKTVLGTFKNN
ncbi:MAG: hypothetical protein H7Y31_05770 [Chitinophagaceae bacterium]|nr:hypothetical protein [Chitinophagaceae bacterium]